MSDSRRLKEKPQMPKALACGMLEDSGRVLFLERGDAHGVERLEMPCIEVFPGEDPVQRLAVEFRRQTGIDAQVHEIAYEGKHNAGSRKRKSWVPCLVFRVTAKSMRASPPPEFSGFRWLKPDEAKGMRLSRRSEWLARSP